MHALARNDSTTFVENPSLCNDLRAGYDGGARPNTARLPLREEKIDLILLGELV